MSIKKFEQFINESVEVNKERLCNNEAMNEIYSKLVELSRQSLDRYRKINSTIETNRTRF